MAIRQPSGIRCPNVLTDLQRVRQSRRAGLPSQASTTISLGNKSTLSNLTAQSPHSELPVKVKPPKPASSLISKPNHRKALWAGAAHSCLGEIPFDDHWLLPADGLLPSLMTMSMPPMLQVHPVKAPLSAPHVSNRHHGACSLSGPAAPVVVQLHHHICRQEPHSQSQVACTWPGTPQQAP